MTEFLLGIASGMVLLLLGQRLQNVYAAQETRKRECLEKIRRDEVCRSLSNIGLGLSTEGLTVMLRNETSMALTVRRVELRTENGLSVVHLLHDHNSVDEIPTPLGDNEERMTVSKKYTKQPREPTDQQGILRPHMCANWVLSFDLTDVVTFEPSHLRTTVEYTGVDDESKLISVDAERLLGGQLQSWIVGWRKKAFEYQVFNERIRRKASTSLNSDGLTPAG